LTVTVRVGMGQQAQRHLTVTVRVGMGQQAQRHLTVTVRVGMGQQAQRHLTGPMPTLTVTSNGVDPVDPCLP
jgi:hypothetical protein